MNINNHLEIGKIREYFCPACGTQNLEKGSASVISPWVRDLANMKQLGPPAYKVCPSCGTGWFGITYSEEILGALYSAYRGETYFRVRNSWEPSYTSALNEGLNLGEDWLDGRRAQIIDSLTNAGCRPNEMSSVLDFGGGHGGVMPRFKHRYLLEANQTVVPEAGIVKLQKLENAKKIDLDLVMCCGVLEHVNNPSELIQSILELKARVFLFEVPAGIPSPRTGIASHPDLLKFISSKRYIWRGIQILERRISARWRQYFPLRCSEHLQFFTKSGLESLLETQGLEILEISETSPNKALNDAKNLGFQKGLIAICRKSD